MVHISLGGAARLNQLSASFWICGRQARAKYPETGSPCPARVAPASIRVFPVVVRSSTRRMRGAVSLIRSSRALDSRSVKAGVRARRSVAESRAWFTQGDAGGACKRLSHGVLSRIARKRAISRLLPPCSSQRRFALCGMGTIQSGVAHSWRVAINRGLITRACSSTCRRKGEPRDAWSPPPTFQALNTWCARPTAENPVKIGGDWANPASAGAIARSENGQSELGISACGSQQTPQSSGEGSRDSKHSSQRAVSPGGPNRHAGHLCVSARSTLRNEPVS